MLHRSSLIEYAARIVGSRAHAEDLVQEAWLRFDEATKGRSLEEPQGYLYRIVRNLALDGRRRISVEENLGVERGPEATPSHALSPEDIALHRDELRRLVAALDQLPLQCRIAFEMHRFAGCKLREIAVFLNLSVPHTHRLVTDAVLHCRRQLKRF